jgi:hypothetical protein
MSVPDSIATGNGTPTWPALPRQSVCTNVGNVVTPRTPPSVTGLGKRPNLLSLLAKLVINTAVPALVYVLLRPHVHSDITALVIGAAVPMAWTVGVLLWKRRVDPVGVFALFCFAIGLLLLVVTGGSELTFKLREDIWSGPVGLACLISVAVRRPLLLYAIKAMARRNPDVAERANDPASRHRLSMITAAIGAILVVHAIVLIVLALTTSTTLFLAISRPISWGIVGGGLAALVWWLRHHSRKQWAQEQAAGAAGQPQAAGAAEQQQAAGAAGQQQAAGTADRNEAHGGTHNSATRA